MSRAQNYKKNHKFTVKVAFQDVKIRLFSTSEELKKVIYQFVTTVERMSPYRSLVNFSIVETHQSNYIGRLEVSASSFEILLSKENDNIESLITDLKKSFTDRLKPWLEGRFSNS